MPQFAQALIAVLRGAPAPHHVMEHLTAAADCLSKVSTESFTSGSYPGIDQESVTLQEARSIEEAVVAIYHAHSDAAGIGTVLWTLSRARNPALRPLFLKHAELAMNKLQTAYHELSQAVCGLDDLVLCGADSSGYPAIPPRLVSELLAPAIDRADAYLKREGILIPVGGQV